MSTHLVVSPYAQDDGSSDPALANALSALAADPALHARALAALASARLLVPVVTQPQPGGGSDDVTMALALLQGADGRRAVAGFTSTAALSAWDPQARPVPVSAADAARSALDSVSGGDGVLVVDVAGAASYVVEGEELAALAEERVPLAPYDDELLCKALAGALHGETGVVAAVVEPALGCDARLRLVVRAGESAPELGQRVALALQNDNTVRAAALRGLDVALGYGNSVGAVHAAARVLTIDPHRHPRRDLCA